jgi:hypothetical protein
MWDRAHLGFSRKLLLSTFKTHRQNMHSLRFAADNLLFLAASDYAASIVRLGKHCEPVSVIKSDFRRGVVCATLFHLLHIDVSSGAVMVLSRSSIVSLDSAFEHFLN